MVVNILDEGHPENRVFLKLYDRRFSERLRDTFRTNPWTKDFEKEYINAVKTGAIREFLDKLRPIPSFEREAEEDWNDGEVEAFLYDQVRQIFDAETAVYDRLRDIQGEMVPRLIARVKLAISLPDDGNSSSPDQITPVTRDEVAEQLDVKGVLLQYIDGFTLSKMTVRAPRSDWQSIVDRAVAVVHAVGDRDILNEDVGPGNFLIRPDGYGSYQVLMIDFGHARLRRQNESDHAWYKAKLAQSEDIAVGGAIRKRLA
ncbi:hypothetical protein CMUS01_01669 [Colletotrichum musicola]|uniref:Protein kinase domain-containing protein n=1 Tax=Colletotrichum musicola TaxID=2175873 RepID=A0A8H6NWH0_9PEZI|nr:hypothetical protein CMUS01_01669 [Colletotrichum musicola]